MVSKSCCCSQHWRTFYSLAWSDMLRIRPCVKQHPHFLSREGGLREPEAALTKRPCTGPCNNARGPRWQRGGGADQTASVAWPDQTVSGKTGSRGLFPAQRPICSFVRTKWEKKVFLRRRRCGQVCATTLSSRYFLPKLLSQLNDETKSEWIVAFI